MPNMPRSLSSSILILCTPLACSGFQHYYTPPHMLQQTGTSLAPLNVKTQRHEETIQSQYGKCPIQKENVLFKPLVCGLCRVVVVIFATSRADSASNFCLCWFACASTSEGELLLSSAGGDLRLVPIFPFCLQHSGIS